MVLHDTVHATLCVCVIAALVVGVSRLTATTLVYC
jgi:hypothetical protein